jgi:autotransporter-associated beta strand protein
LTLNLSVNSTYSGVIAGNVALVENGSANLLLAGTNNYIGNTTVNGGTLELAQPALAAKSTVTVASGAVLQLDFSVTNTVAALVLNGVNQALGVYSSTTSSPYLTGSGSLLVTIPVATNPTNIVASVSGSNLNLSWPADHTGWRLLMQTNNLAQGISSNTNDWGTVSGSASTNQVNVNIDPTKPTEFYRMVYP